MDGIWCCQRSLFAAWHPWEAIDGGTGKTRVRRRYLLGKSRVGPQDCPVDSKAALLFAGGPGRLDLLFTARSRKGPGRLTSRQRSDDHVPSAGDFVGEESLAALSGLRLATAVAVTTCTALKIKRDEILRVIHEEHDFSDLFLKFLLARSMRIQADLVDQLFNSSEKRLARILLLMAEFGKAGEPEPLIPKISQETLAEMVGTTRSRVSFFMNRFRKLGFIEYKGRIRIHKSLLNVVLHDQEPDQSAGSTNPPVDNTIARRRSA